MSQANTDTSSSSDEKNNEIFQDLTFRATKDQKEQGTGEDTQDGTYGDQMPIEIESLCMNCEENGITRLLMVRVPHFRELIVASFECEHCSSTNHEVQFGGAYADRGINIEFSVLERGDLDRQVVKSDYASLEIPELGFEIPANTQKGSLNTLEGILGRAIDGISDQQPVRKVVNPELYEKLEEVIVQLRKCMTFDYTEQEVEEGRKRGALFTVVIRDPSGNSNIESHQVPDPQIRTSHFTRSREQNKMLGLGLTAEDDQDVAEAMREKGIPSERVKSGTSTVDAEVNTSQLPEEDAARFQKHIDVSNADEIVTFTEPCYQCEVTGSLKMLPCRIPHFKEIILMAFTCDNCGYRSNEVKSGGPIAEKGRKITLRVESVEDLARDFLKADTASIEIPEIGLKIAEGSLGGRFTTVEGIIRTIVDQLENTNQFKFGDSSTNIDRQRFREFLDEMTHLADGNRPFTVIVDDPVSNSYIQNLWAPDPDPQLDVEDYERTWEQKEELGLNDMRA